MDLEHAVELRTRSQTPHVTCLSTFPSAPILAISQIDLAQKLGLCQLCCHLVLSIFSVLPDRDDRQFCRPKVLIQNMKRIQATG
jgi:hypothetical protein